MNDVIDEPTELTTNPLPPVPDEQIRWSAMQLAQHVPHDTVESYIQGAALIFDYLKNGNKPVDTP